MKRSLTVVHFANGCAEFRIDSDEPEARHKYFHFHCPHDADDNTIGGAMRRWLVKGETTEILAHYNYVGYDGLHEHEIDIIDAVIVAGEGVE